MAQQLRALTALWEDPCSIPSFQMVAYKSSLTPDPQDLTLFWTTWVLGTQVVHDIHMCRQNTQAH